MDRLALDEVANDQGWDAVRVSPNREGETAVDHALLFCWWILVITLSGQLSIERVRRCGRPRSRGRQDWLVPQLAGRKHRLLVRIKRDGAVFLDKVMVMHGHGDTDRNSENVPPSNSLPNPPP